MKLQMRNGQVLWNEHNFQVIRNLKEIETGLTGGSHGTEHAFTDYRLTSELVVRVVQPGATVGGWIALLEDDSAGMVYGAAH